MPNLTLSLDEDLLDRAKDAARREHVSLNKLVRDVLADRVSVKGNDRLSLDDWFAMADRSRMAPDPLPVDGGRGWTRNDLYQGNRT